MPKQKNNIVMKSTTGMFGGQVVFKERAGESYVSAPPQFAEDRQFTPAQLQYQERFKESIAYASEAVKDPILKAQYQAKAKRGQSAHNIAFQDAFHAPVVHEIIPAYNGVAGDLITVQAEDDFKVTGVKVSIHNAAGDLIEEGDALVGKKFNWTYVVRQANPNVAGSKIRAVATDLADNEGSLEIIL